MLTVEVRGLKKAIRDLRLFRDQAIPYAARSAVNATAFATQKEWREQIGRSMTLRNKFTTRSIQVVRASGLDMRRMMSVVGSVASYMGVQESGGTVRGRSAHQPIPGPVAAGQAAGSKRTRIVMRGRRLSAIHVARAPSTGNARQRNAVAISMARRKGNRFALLERPGGGRGLFLLGTGKRKVTTRLVFDLSRSSVRVPPNPTLQHSLRAIEPRLPRLFLDAWVYQLRRHRVLGY